MSKRRKILIIFGISILALFVGYIFTEPIKFGICRSEYTYQTNYKRIEQKDINLYPKDLIKSDKSDFYTFDIARGCLDSTDESLGQPLGYFSIVMIFLSIISLFVQEQKFYSWLRFSKYYLPIAAGVIFLSPTIDSSILGFDKEFMTWLLAGIFFITSLCIIIFKRKK